MNNMTVGSIRTTVTPPLTSGIYEALLEKAERERDEARRVAENLVEYAHECLVKLESWGKGYDRLEREMEDIREDIASCEKLKEAAK